MLLKLIILMILLFAKEVSARSIEDRFPYKFIYKPEFKKGDVNSITITLIVKSAVPNFRLRNAIRDTWGNENQNIPNTNIRTVFNVGLSNATKLAMESYVFEDILQSDFQDSYWNLTAKTVMGIRWAMEMCKSSDFFLLSDDDYLILLKRIVDYLRRSGFHKNDPLYIGYFTSRRPQRERGQKWKVSYEEYPRSLYPPFVVGGAVVLSRKGLEAMSQGIAKAQYIRLEDVFLGLAAETVGLKPINLSTVSRYCIKNQLFSGKVDILKEKIMVSHGFNKASDLEPYWEKLKSQGIV
ncbi:B3GALT5 family protein [Megaselia abdita]